MIALKTHKTLQHVSVRFQIILRELVFSLLKSLIKTVRSQILVMRQQFPEDDLKMGRNLLERFVCF